MRMNLISLAVFIFFSAFQEANTSFKKEAIFGEWVPDTDEGLTKVKSLTFYPNGLLNFDTNGVKYVQNYKLISTKSGFEVLILPRLSSSTPIGAFRVNVLDPKHLEMHYGSDSASRTKILLKKKRDIPTGMIPIRSVVHF